MKHSKRYRALKEKVDTSRVYSLAEAVKLVKENAGARFDETVEVAVKLGIDPKKQDQMVAGTVSLPHGTGKQVRVLAFVKGDKVDEAQAAGADYVGLEDLVEKISSGWTDFDVAVATPDTMAIVGRLGKILRRPRPLPLTSGRRCGRSRQAGSVTAVTRPVMCMRRWARYLLLKRN